MTERQIRAAVWFYLKQKVTIGTAYTLAAKSLNLDDRLVACTWLRMHNRWLRYILLKKYKWNTYEC